MDCEVSDMLKNVLIVVDDIEKSIEFYKDLFGLQVILQNEGNVIGGSCFAGCRFMGEDTG